MYEATDWKEQGLEQLGQTQMEFPETKPLIRRMSSFLRDLPFPSIPAASVGVFKNGSGSFVIYSDYSNVFVRVDFEPRRNPTVFVGHEDSEEDPYFIGSYTPESRASIQWLMQQVLCTPGGTA